MVFLGEEEQAEKIKIMARKKIFFMGLFSNGFINIISSIIVRQFKNVRNKENDAMVFLDKIQNIHCLFSHRVKGLVIKSHRQGGLGYSDKQQGSTGNKR